MNSNSLHKRSYLAAIIIGLLPAWMVLLPLDITRDPAGWQVLIRTKSLAVPLAQVMFVLLAMSTTFSPFRSISQLPSISKAAVLLWLIVAGFVSFQSGKDHFSASIGLLKIIIASLFLLALINLRIAFGLRFLTVLWTALGVGTVAYVALWTIHIFVVLPQGEEWVTRIPGVNNVRHTGHFAITGVIAGLFTFLASRNNPNIWLRWIIPSVFATAGLGLALWTGSRGPLLASLISMFVTTWVAVKRRKIVAGFCGAAALVATVAVAFLPVPHPIYGIAGATGLADVSAQDAYGASSGRTLLWTDTVKQIKERPLLGWGVEQYGISNRSELGQFLHPHNFPLQLMFSGGLLSVLLLFLMIIPAVRESRWPSINGPSASGVGCVIAMSVYSLYDGTLYFSYPITILLIGVATSIKLTSRQLAHDRSG